MLISSVRLPNRANNPPPNCVALKVTDSNACLYCATVAVPDSVRTPVLAL